MHQHQLHIQPQFTHSIYLSNLHTNMSTKYSHSSLNIPKPSKLNLWNNLGRMARQFQQRKERTYQYTISNYLPNLPSQHSVPKLSNHSQVCVQQQQYTQAAPRIIQTYTIESKQGRMDFGSGKTT